MTGYHGYHGVHEDLRRWTASAHREAPGGETTGETWIVRILRGWKDVSSRHPPVFWDPSSCRGFVREELAGKTPAASLKDLPLREIRAIRG